MRYLPLILGLFISNGLFSQVVFLETFDEGDNAVTGTDDVGGVVWNTVCPTCVTGHYEIIGGVLEAVNTDEAFGVATFTTDLIDISSCMEGLNISLSLAESGDMEFCTPCAFADGSNCVDWVKLEYRIDGLIWNEVAGTSCLAGVTSAPGEMIQIGDIIAPDGGPVLITSPCVDIGSDLELRISVLTTAGDEFWFIDDVAITCTSCLLPVKFEKINGSTNEFGLNEIFWTTLQERSNDYFRIERSYDGLEYENIGQVDGAGNSVEAINYSFTDQANQTNLTTYYRIKQFDFNGDFTISNPISIRNNNLSNFTFSNNQVYYHLSNTSESYLVNIYNMNGTIVETRTLNGSGTFNWNKNGLFLIEVPELGIRQKLTTF